LGFAKQWMMGIVIMQPTAVKGAIKDLHRPAWGYSE
jgi:hypothetical protein